MKHEFELWRPGKDQPDGRITWDSDAGTLSGDLAEELEKLIDQAIADGVLVSHPMPTSYRITRPLHDAAQLGAIISLRAHPRTAGRCDDAAGRRSRCKEQRRADLLMTARGFAVARCCEPTPTGIVTRNGNRTSSSCRGGAPHEAAAGIGHPRAGSPAGR